MKEQNEQNKQNEGLMTMEQALETISNMDKSKLNKPSDEEIEHAAKKLSIAVEEFNQKTYGIGDPDKAKDIFKFFEEYINNFVFWTKNGWMGVIRLNEELIEQKKNHKKGEPVKLGYQALEFVNYMLNNPGGQGLKTAKAIEQIAELYVYVMETVSKNLEIARKELKDIQFLQDSYTAMSQGFYLEREDGVEKPMETPEDPTDVSKPAENSI